jgi:phosphoglycerate dehydrogenase-like enzyme
MKVVIVRKSSAEIEKTIREAFPPEWKVVLTGPEGLRAEIADTDALIPEHNAVDEALLCSAPRLRIVQTGAGYDNVDLAACARRGIAVANAAGINARAVAEHVFAFIFVWYKNIDPFDRIVKNGGWTDTADRTGAVLSDKRIGIVGIGRIGREVARLARAFGMDVLGCGGRFLQEEPGIRPVDLETLLRESDIVTLHVSLNEQTRHLIGRREFARMKGDAFLVNTARGGVVDEAALFKALKEGKIGGAGLDVFETEPLPADSPLRSLNNVLLTPHVAGEPDYRKANTIRYRFFADNIRRVAADEIPVNALTPPCAIPA